MEEIEMAGTRKDDGSITKSDLVESVSNKLQIPRGKAELIINGVFDCMERALRNGDRIEIRGFGSFEIRHYEGYEGRNPRTGDPVGVQPKRLPFFKVGKELKERVNEGYLKQLAAKEGGINASGSTPNSSSEGPRA
jgi:integration host factor subunit beta